VVQLLQGVPFADLKYCSPLALGTAGAAGTAMGLFAGPLGVVAAIFFGAVEGALIAISGESLCLLYG
jgi:hypothetical protein